MFDITYLRPLPNLVVMAPGDGSDLESMLGYALHQDRPTALRYPKTSAADVARPPVPVEGPAAETLHWGQDGMIICCGALLDGCVAAAEMLRDEALDVGVINARFVKPLDQETVLRAVQQPRFALTVEEGALMGGFGSGVLELACDANVDASRLLRLGVPDRFVEHGERQELLADLGLDAPGIAEACRRLASRTRPRQRVRSRQMT
jgi:1-deoxy-D-xylulose-5-phosphate synthase